MDPNELLKRILDHAAAIGENHRRAMPKTAHADELAAGIGELDAWITGGGFLPARWSRK